MVGWAGGGMRPSQGCALRAPDCAVSVPFPSRPGACVSFGGPCARRHTLHATVIFEHELGVIIEILYIQKHISCECHPVRSDPYCINRVIFRFSCYDTCEARMPTATYGMSALLSFSRSGLQGAGGRHGLVYVRCTRILFLSAPVARGPSRGPSRPRYAWTVQPRPPPRPLLRHGSESARQICLPKRRRGRA